MSGFALRGGYTQTPTQMAGFTNAVQERLEGGLLGIPAIFKDNARNHVEMNPMFGIAVGAGAFIEFPKKAGLAAAALGAGAPVCRHASKKNVCNWAHRCRATRQYLRLSYTTSNVTVCDSIFATGFKF